MSVGASEERGVEHSGEREVADVARSAGEEPGILYAPERPPDESRRGQLCTRALSPVIAWRPEFGAA